MPVGFAHGFCVLSEVADVTYKCSTYYDAAVERGFHYADPDVAIAWPDDIELPSPRAIAARRGWPSWPPSCPSDVMAVDSSQPGRELRERIDAVPFWFHSIELGGGLVTPGHKPPAVLQAELDALELPDLRGKSVLDIGGWDGFFAFEAERRGASRVAVVDHYMWSMDVPGQQDYWRRCREDGVTPRPYHETEFWHPDTLPGKRGFDLAREALGSRVESLVADFMTCDLAALGRWDVVLYLGVALPHGGAAERAAPPGGDHRRAGGRRDRGDRRRRPRGRSAVALLPRRRAQRRRLQLVGAERPRAARRAGGGGLQRVARDRGAAGGADRGRWPAGGRSTTG